MTTMKRLTILLLMTLTMATADAEPQAWTLDDFQGQTHQFPADAVANQQVTVLFFWATWCPYCKQLMPHMQSALYQYQDDLNLKVYALNIKEDDDPQAYLNRHGYGFTLFPEADEVAEQYEIWGTPGVLIFDQQGQLVFDLRRVQTQHLVKQNAPHSAKSVRTAPYWAAEIRKALAKL